MILLTAAGLEPLLWGSVFCDTPPESQALHFKAWLIQGCHQFWQFTTLL